MTLKLRNSNFIILFVSAVASFITAFMGSAINVAIPEIGNEFSSSAVLLSWIATAYILTSVVLLIPAGRLSDKIEPQYVSSAGMFLITVCLGFLGFISADSSITYFIILLAFLGIGFALFSSPNSNAIMSSVDKKYIGTASTVLSLMRMMGQMFSMAIVIVIFSVVIGKAEISPDIYPQLISSTKIAFLLFAFLCFLGIFASLSRGKIHD